MKRRRNPKGVVGWASAHPWMTFFLVMGALGTVRVIFSAPGANQLPGVRVGGDDA